MASNERPIMFQESDLLEFLDAEGYSPIMPRPRGFGKTVNEYREHFGCSETVARGKLDKAVRDGLLVKHLMKDGPAGRVMVYSREWPPKV